MLPDEDLAVPLTDHYGPRVRSVVESVTSDDVVLVGDPAGLEQKLASLGRAGLDRVNVVSDFDRTITRFWNNGRMASSCHGVIDGSSLVSDDFRTRIKNLFDEYYPLEISPDLTPAAREAKMVEWWSRAHNMYIEHGIQLDHLPSMLKESNIALRERADKVISGLANNGVPLYVLSAGISNVIDLFLRQHELHYEDHVGIVANTMHFGRDGKLAGFNEDLIHSMNKNGTMLYKNPVTRDRLDRGKERDHLILLGDNLMDAKMQEGIKAADVIKVGFLNDKVKERINDYSKLFDIVVVNDGSMHVVQSMIEATKNGDI